VPDDPPDAAVQWLHATHLWHPQVHQHDVDVELLAQPNRLGSVTCFAHDLEIGIVGKDTAQAISHDRVVVDEEQPDGRHQRSAAGEAIVEVSGTQRLIVAPAPGHDSIVSRPPTRSARRCMPTRP